MKYLFLLFATLTIRSFAQHTPLPHGMLYGQKVDTLQMMPAAKLESFMGTKVRISTTIKGKVIRVTQTKGGWFDMDAGNGHIINVHFKNYGINLPADLRGRTVMIQGVAQKQLVADDMQHYAGDTTPHQKHDGRKQPARQPLMFEATGLVVL